MFVPDDAYICSHRLLHWYDESSCYKLASLCAADRLTCFANDFLDCIFWPLLGRAHYGYFPKHNRQAGCLCAPYHFHFRVRLNIPIVVPLPIRSVPFRSTASGYPNEVGSETLSQSCIQSALRPCIGIWPSMHPAALSFHCLSRT